MPLKLSLRPGEKFVVNGAVVQNGDRRAALVLQNKASVLREKDIMQPDDAETPAKRIYFPIMLMYLDEGGRAPNATATYLQDWISRYYAAEEANVISRSFVKLREVTLTYNVPMSILDKTFMKRASFSLLGRNLLYFAEKKDVDIDQFVASDSYSSLQSPTLRRYGFNVNITF